MNIKIELLSVLEYILLLYKNTDFHWSNCKQMLAHFLSWYSAIDTEAFF